jgi:LPS sulfotransferase NodH
MTPSLPLAFSLSLALALAVVATGCGGSKDDLPAPTTPKEAAKQIDSAFATAEPELQQNMHTASAALREGQYEKAVVALQVTRSTTNLTLEQGLAVHNSLVTLEANLINAAASGDANAQRAYDLLKKSKRN